MSAELDSLRTELIDAIARAPTLSALEEVRIAALGRKGRVSELMQGLGALPPGRAQELWPGGQQPEGRRGARRSRPSARCWPRPPPPTSSRQSAPTSRLPTREGPLTEGRIHPVSQVTDEITEIFADMGFSIAEGPDIETDFNNFTALNIPPEHPARQDHDTFYFAEGPDGTRPVLRTHTSPVQIRTMLREKPPIRIIAPGRVYRMRFGPDPYADVPSGRGSGHR